jgi:hypothetical protein
MMRGSGMARDKSSADEKKDQLKKRQPECHVALRVSGDG